MIALGLIFLVLQLLTLLAASISIASDIRLSHEVLQGPNTGNISLFVEKSNKDLATLNDIASSPCFEPVRFVPRIGTTFVSAKKLVMSASRVLAAAEPLVHSLQESQVSANGSLAAQIANLRNARFINQVQAFESSIDAASAQFNAAEIKNADPDLARIIKPSASALTQASRGVKQLLPIMLLATEMLGEKRPHTWFVATQNLAEARGTGGIIGSFAVIEIKNATVKPKAAGSDQDLAKIAAVNFKALPSHLRNVWGEEPAVWQDLNVSAHVPYAGRQIFDTLKHRLPIDSVVFLGQGTVSNMVAAAGPIEVDGVQIDYRNVSDFLAKDIYAKHPKVSAKNAWVRSFMKTLFSRLSAKDFNLKDLWASALTNQSRGRLSAWSADPHAQQPISLAVLSGSVSNTFGSTTYFTLNNAGGNKLDAYLKVDATYNLGACNQMTDDSLVGRRGEMRLTLTNTAPSRGLARYVTTRLDVTAGQKYQIGKNHTLVSVYAPRGSSIDYFEINSELGTATEGFDNKHPVWVVDVRVNPGETTTLGAVWVEPIVNTLGLDIQSAPKLTAPVAFNAIKTTVGVAARCKIPNG